MNKLLTRKKHSKRIAKILFKQGVINKKVYDSLYLEQYNIFKRPKRKDKYGYRLSRYYTELFFCVVDYWGEAEETSVIDNAKERIYWKTINIGNNGNIIKEGKTFKNTKDLIKYIMEEKV